jgi:Fe-S-cluster-containing hydrogenase component 2
VALCPGEAIEFDKAGYCYRVNEDKCVGCGKCLRFCPYSAMSVEKREDK